MQIDDGYYLDVYTESIRESDRNGIIIVESFKDTFFIPVENIGSARSFAIKVFIDYIEHPFLIEDTVFEAYYFDAPSEFGTVKNYAQISLQSLKE